MKSAISVRGRMEANAEKTLREKLEEFNAALAPLAGEDRLAADALAKLFSSAFWAGYHSGEAAANRKEYISQ
jgi:hypothetical protein